MKTILNPKKCNIVIKYFSFQKKRKIKTKAITYLRKSPVVGRKTIAHGY